MECSIGAFYFCSLKIAFTFFKVFNGVFSKTVQNEMFYLQNYSFLSIEVSFLMISVISFL